MLNLKAKLIALGALLLSGLAFILRFQQVKSQRDRAKEAAAKYKAWSERQTENMEADAEIEQKFSHRADEATKALKNDEIPAHLRNPRD